jgi:L-lactate permease
LSARQTTDHQERIMITVQDLADELGQAVAPVAAVLLQMPGFTRTPSASRGICDDDANVVRAAFGAPVAATRRPAARLKGGARRWREQDITDWINEETGQA